MIDIAQVWVPQILGYCELVTDRERLIAAFNQEPEAMWTSVVSYAELVCQVFDDLDATGMLSELRQSEESAQLKDALSDFVANFERFDASIGDHWQPDFDVPEWESVELAARSALAAAAYRKPK